MARARVKTFVCAAQVRTREIGSAQTLAVKIPETFTERKMLKRVIVAFAIIHKGRKGVTKRKGCVVFGVVCFRIVKSRNARGDLVFCHCHLSCFQA